MAIWLKIIYAVKTVKRSLGASLNFKYICRYLFINKNFYMQIKLLLHFKTYVCINLFFILEDKFLLTRLTLLTPTVYTIHYNRKCRIKQILISIKYVRTCLLRFTIYFTFNNFALCTQRWIFTINIFP